jgi:hypothetical protein
VNEANDTEEKKEEDPNSQDHQTDHRIQQPEPGFIQVESQEATEEAAPEIEQRGRQDRMGERERITREAEIRTAAGRAETVRSRRDHGLRINPELNAQREEQQRTEEERNWKRQELIRKKEEHEGNISRGVNIPQLNAQQMRKVKEGRGDLFAGELNPLLEQMMPTSDQHEECIGFEGVYKECMHRIRMHIIHAIGRDRNDCIMKGD